MLTGGVERQWTPQDKQSCDCLSLSPILCIHTCVCVCVCAQALNMMAVVASDGSLHLYSGSAKVGPVPSAVLPMHSVMYFVLCCVVLSCVELCCVVLC